MFRKLFIFSLAGFLAATGMSTLSAAEDVAINGAEVVNNNCGRCHNSRSIDEFSLEEWVVIIPHMRERAHLTGAESDAVLGFFQSLQETSSENLSGSEVAARTGEELITRYGCLGCHSFNGEGSSVAPNLDNTISLRSEDFVRRKLLNPKFNNSATPMPRSSINNADIEVLIAYLKNENIR